MDDVRRDRGTVPAMNRDEPGLALANQPGDAADSQSDHHRNGAGAPPRSQAGWIRLFRDTVHSTLHQWATIHAAVEVEQTALRAELTSLATPATKWGDRYIVERLVRAAATVEGVASHPHSQTPIDVDVNSATAAFTCYLREMRRHPNLPLLGTFPDRIQTALDQLDSIPEEASCELSFIAAMAIAALDEDASAAHS
jgi:hypothetical protein